MSTKIFIERHSASVSDAEPIVLAFAKSTLIKVYPCGRRRSADVVKTGAVGNGDNINIHNIPFDPEARLNTEFNNRKHSALNGFAHSYINEWNSGAGYFSFVVGGYTFELSFPEMTQETTDQELSIVSNFATNLVNYLIDGGADVADTIYANIRLEKTPIFKGDLDYYTWVLGRQAEDTDANNVELDIQISESAEIFDSVHEEQNYYFSGLSFSTKPLTGNSSTYSKADVTANGNTEVIQQVFSLCILKKINNNWLLNENAKLPVIEHGDTANSIRVQRIDARAIHYLENVEGGMVSTPVAVLEVINTSNDTKGPFKLKFTQAKQHLT